MADLTYKINRPAIVRRLHCTVIVNVCENEHSVRLAEEYDGFLIDPKPRLRWLVSIL